MSFTLAFFVDGACRNNGKPDAESAIGVALRNGERWIKQWAHALQSPPTATNQRAELTAIQLALMNALAIMIDWVHEDPPHYFSGARQIHIYSDSQYAVGAMEGWIKTWKKNGWKNNRGLDVGNKDLMVKLDQYHNFVKKMATVQYFRVPRTHVGIAYADALCNAVLDRKNLSHLEDLGVHAFKKDEVERPVQIIGPCSKVSSPAKRKRLVYEEVEDEDEGPIFVMTGLAYVNC